MKRFVQGENRSQSTLFPESLDDYISQDNPIRVIDVFVDSLDLKSLGFDGVIPKETGRPSYHPAVMLKLYIYGYLNRVQSSRRLEKETQRNLELMWLLERLKPDFKTIADFRKNNGKGIKKVCRRFIDICRELSMFTQAVVAIDGSKFKAVNNRDKNFTKNKIKARIKRAEENIQRYLDELDKADLSAIKSSKKEKGLNEKIRLLKEKIAKLEQLEKERDCAPDGQISQVDPDARAMAQKGQGTGLVGYNVQIAVDTKNHLIVAHETTNIGNDRSQLFRMSVLAQQAMGRQSLTTIADKGYYSAAEIKSVHDAGMKPLVPKSPTSAKRKKGMFTKDDFQYIAKDDEYRCPNNKRLIYRFSTVEHGLNLRGYWYSKCGECQLKARCTEGKQRRVRRWEHEDVLDDMEKEFVRRKDIMTVRKSTVEHPFATIKMWMGFRHFHMRRMKHVSTEMSLHVLAYNLNRVMNIVGKKKLIRLLGN